MNSLRGALAPSLASRRQGAELSATLAAAARQGWIAEDERAMAAAGLALIRPALNAAGQGGPGVEGPKAGTVALLGVGCVPQQLTVLRAFVEAATDGGAAGWVLDLPSCYCWAPDHDRVLSLLPQAARFASAWLRRHGEPVQLTSPLSVEVVELLVRDGSMGRGGTWALFLPDLVPLTAEELHHGLLYLQWSRLDLFETLADLPGGAMEWCIPGSRTIREILIHLAQT
ncbi:MAG: hypothetical protein AB1609_12810, partial [Bacillota bacterium]